jgi:hypothetical protein
LGQGATAEERDHTDKNRDNHPTQENPTGIWRHVSPLFPLVPHRKGLAQPVHLGTNYSTLSGQCKPEEGRFNRFAR